MGLESSLGMRNQSSYAASPGATGSGGVDRDYEMVNDVEEAHRSW